MICFSFEVLNVFLAECLLVLMMELFREVKFCQGTSVYKGHLSKFKKNITTFLNEIVPGNLLHIEIISI